MSIVLADRVQETTITTGTGTINLLGAEAQCQSFISGVGNGNQTYYCLVSGDGTNWEVGHGTVTAGSPNTLSRTTILASSNGGSAISLVGTSIVFGDAPAALLGILANGTTGTGEVVLASAPSLTGTVSFTGSGVFETGTETYTNAAAIHGLSSLGQPGIYTETHSANASSGGTIDDYAVAFADNTSDAIPVWGRYTEVHYLNAAAVAGGSCIGHELSFYSTVSPCPVLDPFSGTGGFDALRIDAGIGSGSPENVPIAIRFPNNGAQFEAGLSFDYNALDITSGRLAPAVQMGPSHSVTWFGSAGNRSVDIAATATSGYTSLQFTNGIATLSGDSLWDVTGNDGTAFPGLNSFAAIRITNTNLSGGNGPQLQFAAKDATPYAVIGGDLLDGTNDGAGNLLIAIRPYSTAGSLTQSIVFLAGGDVQVTSGSALATSAVSGFFSIPVMAGVPTSNPGNAASSHAEMVVDTSDKKLEIYIDGVGWYHVSLTAGT